MVSNRAMCGTRVSKLCVGICVLCVFCISRVVIYLHRVVAKTEDAELSMRLFAKLTPQGI